MPKVKVYNINAEECGSLTLSDEVFKAPYNEALIHEVIVAYLANQRQGTKSTLTRTEVRGHAKKPWAQKHTGNARQGSTKGPQWTGGGVVFAPKPRDFSKKVNAKAKKVAFVSALSKKLEQNEITVIDEIKIDAKTKEMQKVLDNFKFDKSTVLVLDDKNENVMRASNNIQNLSVVNADLLNTYEVVANKNLLITKEAIKKIQEACK
ncbi:MAG: 50S ribosomal protein L4 [Christensenellales bacterium]